eukprot:scaffold25778_cov78-Cyclotella_meneghiniana.AAC.9
MSLTKSTSLPYLALALTADAASWARAGASEYEWVQASASDSMMMLLRCKSGRLGVDQKIMLRVLVVYTSSLHKVTSVCRHHSTKDTSRWERVRVGAVTHPHSSLLTHPFCSFILHPLSTF